MFEDEDGPKISLKMAHVSIQKFNDVGIPHHVGLLKNHKSNDVHCTEIRNTQIISACATPFYTSR